MTNTAYALNNERNHGMRDGDPINRQYQHDTTLKGGATSPAPLSPSRWKARRSSAASTDGTSTTNDTTSTATTSTEPSHDNRHDALIGSAMMRTRTNFGDYSYYVPPDTPSSPHRAPAGVPVSPKRDSWSSPVPADRRVPQKLKLPVLTASPEREPRKNQSLATDPAPLDEKRLQFFDDVPSDQVPFDQVWNQQEFTLDQKNSDDGKDMDLDEELDLLGEELDQSLDEELDQSLRSVTSKPFDEEHPTDRMGAPGSSAFSAFTVSSSSTSAALPPPPPPPPPLAWHKKLPSPRSPKGKVETNTERHSMAAPVSPERRYHSDDNDIPSDEDDLKRNHRDSPEAQERSLATASKRTTAENVGARKSAEDLSNPGSPRDEDDDKSVDSLFDFEKQKLRSHRSSKSDPPISPPKSPSEWRKHTPTAELALSDEETSLEGQADGKKAVKDLRSRAQQAFATRRRFAPRKSPSPSPRPPSPRKAASPSPRPSSPRKAASPSPLPSSPRKAALPLPQKSIAAVPSPQAQAATALSKATLAQAVTPVSAPASAPRVSFTAKNTVHTFQHEFDMYSEQSESVVSNGTFEDKQGIGADVEEAIKDIFMINALGACNPSPRQIRYHSDTRFERRDSEQSENFYSDDDDDDDDTAGKSDDESANDKVESVKPVSRGMSEMDDVEEKLKRVPSQNEDVFFEAMLSMVEGGLGAMSAAFGFAAGDSAATEAPASKSRSSPTSKSRSSPTSKSRSSPTSKSRSSPTSARPPAEVETPRKDISRSAPTKGSPRRSSSSSNGNSIEGVFDSMSDYILGPDKSAESSDVEDLDIESTAPQDEREFDNKIAPMAPSEELDDEDEDEAGNEPQSLEDDPRLLELAKQSALCMHEVLGTQYDESRGVDISDVKFAVVVLSLPLGIIFQEDYSGCWITKIMPKGNADRSGKIEAGDQLAAINGRSSIGMKVDDICAAISVASSQSTEIELTFLRYIGPFQPLPSDGASLNGMLKEQTDEDTSIGTYPLGALEEDEKPRSTMSITGTVDSKSSKKKGLAPKSPKRGSIRKKFKWLSRGKKAQKAE